MTDCSVLNRDRRLPSRIVPPRSPGWCSGISITYHHSNDSTLSLSVCFDKHGNTWKCTSKPIRQYLTMWQWQC